MATLLTAATGYVDPRVRRTREMLVHALEQLLSTTAFEKISVGEIAEAATLNRATFYAHYVDKFALLEDLVAARFQGLLQKRAIVFDGTCPSALYGITLAVCDFLADMPYCTEQRQMEQYLESAMVAIVQNMIARGLSSQSALRTIVPEMIAAALAGAIYSAAKQWIRTPDRPDAKEATALIFKLISPMMVSLP